MKSVCLLFCSLVTFDALADVYCHVIRGQESIEVTVVDAFVGKTARVHRTHPIVSYPSKDIFVTAKETNKSLIFSNSRENFNLKLNKELMFALDDSAYLKGDFKYEDIITRLKCNVE